MHPPTPLHRPLRVGVVGQGPWGQRLAARWAGAPGVDWRGAAAPGLRPLEVLLDEGLDLALVATDPASHAAVAARCLRAGGVVFVEKPPALDIDELAELEAAAGAPGRLIGSSVWLAVPWVRAARAALAARPAGRGARLELWRHNPSAPATGIDELVDLAPHDLLLLHALTGRSADRAQAHRRPGGVRAQLWWRNPGSEDGEDGEDAALHVTIDLSWALPRARGLRLWEGGAPRLWAAESAGGPAEGAERDATGAPAPLALPDGPEPLIAERDAILGALRQADTAALEAAWAQQRRGVATLAALRASLAADGALVPIPAPPDPPWTTPPPT